MTLAELMVAIGIKVENLDQLAALETMLRNVTAQARAAVAAISALNGTNTKAPAIPSVPAPGAPSVTPGTPPTQPAQPPGIPAQPGATPVGPAPVGPVPNPTRPAPAPNMAPVRPAPGGPAPTSPNFIGPHPSAWVNQQRGLALSTAGMAKMVTGVKALSGHLNKLTVMMAGVATVAIVLASKAISATMEIANFGESTGLSTDKLQQFSHAAQVGGASGKGMLALLDSLQLKQAAIQLGEGDLSPFAFFGIDPNQDTNAVIDQLRAKLKTFSKEQLGVAREMAARLGVDSQMFAAMRRNAESLSSAFVMDKAAIDSTQALNAAWQDLSFKLAAIRNQLVASIAPAFTAVAAAITKVLKPIAVFSKWLSSSTTSANVFRGTLAMFAVVLGVLAVAVVIIAGAVTALSAALGLATAATTILGSALWASGIAEVILLITGVVALAIATFVALGLIIDDIITTFQGGESACRELGDAIGSLIAGPVLALMEAFSSLGDWAGKVWDSITDKISGAISSIGGLVPDWLKNLFGGGAKVSVDPMKSITDAAAQPPSNQRGMGGSTANQTNDIQINVDGSKDPRATGNAVRDALAKSYGEAAYQMPVASY